MAKKNNEVAVLDSEMLLALKDAFPVEQGGFNRVILPRLGLVSQDKFEGKGKNAVLVKEAGQFFTEVQTEELDEEQKKIWDHKDIGTEVEGIILYQRKQLRMYDEATELYTSSPVYDSEDDIVPLFCEKKEVAKGTPAELKAKYMYTDKAGKTKSALEDNRILFVLVDGVVYQMNLRGSSMYSWLTYARKVAPPTVVTKFSSEAKEKGEIAWNQMTFSVARSINNDELGDVLARVQEIKTGIEAEKGYYAKADSEDAKAEKKWKEIG